LVDSDIKYYKINSKYLAYALSFIGFKFYKFNEDNGGVRYIFENSEVLQDSIEKLVELKQGYK